MTGIEWAYDESGKRAFFLRDYVYAQGWGLEALDAIERGDVWKAEYAATMAARHALNTAMMRE